MKKVSMFLMAAGIVFAACNSPKGDAAATTDAQDVTVADANAEYSVDSTSTVTWTGSKPTGSHTGKLTITSGNILVKDNMVASGSEFVIDINTLTNEDLTEEDGKTNLINHLKSPDFFDVEKFPTAKFVVSDVAPYTADTTATLKDANYLVSGNLTLKDSTKNISFPAKIQIEGGKMSVNADFNIDRTMWGMNYKGPNNPQDWFISKEVNLKVNLSATKK